MNDRNSFTHFVFCTALLGFSLAIADPAVPGQIRSYSTIKSIGIEWDITGDTNLDATCSVQYRRQGETAWKNFVPLFRVDFRGWYGADTADRRYNMLAGSVLFLDPATAYEIRLGLRDPDGTTVDTNLTISTRPVPAITAGGRTLHVVAGTGSGDGSVSAPFKGLAAAQTAAAAGDIILVHKGSFGNFIFDKSGTTNGYIVWKSAGDGDAVLDYGRIVGHHIWLYGLKFVNSIGQTYALVGQSGSVSNVVTRCFFTGFNYNITMQSGSDDWYIADNTIVGDKTDPRVSGDFEGEGIELEHTSGHTVCYNTISRVADGVSYANRNCDIFNNDIFDVVDDGVEPDYGYANIRVWQNRITNPRNHAFSFQPMFCGPWYFVRNQVMGVGCYMLKYRVVDRFLLAHNTFVGWNTLDIFDQNILYGFSRNNLWIQAGGSGYIWEAMPCTEAGSCTQPERWTPDYRTDVDRDGFDWGQSSPMFKWFDPAQRFSSLSGFTTATGIEKNGLHVDKADLFDSLFDPGSDSLYDRHCLTLRKGCGAVDKGDILAGINEDFDGMAPDLGAYELNRPLPHYGVRPEGSEPVVNRVPASPAPAMTITLVPHRAGRGITILFTPPESGTATACIFDVSGKIVARLQHLAVAQKPLQMSWGGRVAGVYLLQFTQAKNRLSTAFFLR
jgi:hypothetical protein